MEYTKQQYHVVNQINVTNGELIKVAVLRTKYAHNQPFDVSCRNFNRMTEQSSESASRQILRA